MVRVILVLPAYAGMIRQADGQTLHRVGAPRVCGDDPTMGQIVSSIWNVLPAYAGMIRLTRGMPGMIDGAPRVCGDDPRGSSSRTSFPECSPRMRG